MWKTINGAARETGYHPTAIQRAVRAQMVPVIGTGKRKVVWVPAVRDFGRVFYLNPRLARELFFLGKGKAIVKGTSPPQVVHLFEENDNNLAIGVSIKINARAPWGDIEWALSCLEGRERQVIESRCGKNGLPTLEEIGNQMGISRERVRQIESKAIDKVLALLADRKAPFQRRPANEEEISLFSGCSDWVSMSDPSLGVHRSTLYALGPRQKRIPSMRQGIWLVYKPAVDDYNKYVAAVKNVPRLFLSAAPVLSFLGHGRVVHHQIAKSAAHRTNRWWESPEVLSNAFDIEEAIRQVLSLAEEKHSTEFYIHQILELAKTGSITSVDVSAACGLPRIKAWYILSQMSKWGLLTRLPREGKRAARFSLREHNSTPSDETPNPSGTQPNQRRGPG